ncbi:MAG: hypothetical protein ACE5JZ_13060, partial [Kiloniellales bacterium]
MKTERQTVISASETVREPRRGEGAERPSKCLMSRRQFLLTSGATSFTVMVMLNPGAAHAQQVPATVATYPRKFIAKLSQLKQDVPVDFTYPDQGAYAESMLV